MVLSCLYGSQRLRPEQVQLSILRTAISISTISSAAKGLSKTELSNATVNEPDQRLFCETSFKQICLFRNDGEKFPFEVAH